MTHSNVHPLLAVVLLLLVTPHACAYSDSDYLNFALNFEYLAANYYRWATNGTGIGALGLGGPEAVGGTVANFTTTGQLYGMAWCDDELRHVAALQQLVGATDAVAQPAIDIMGAFSSFMNGAIGSTVAPTYNPYSSDVLFLTGALIFEDVSVTMYNGLLPLLTSSASRGLVANMLAVETAHAAAIRTILQSYPNSPLFFSGLPISTVIAAVSAYRTTLDPSTLDAPLLTPAGLPIVIPTDAQSLPFARDPSAVLKILYLGGNSSGGFFPSGVSGVLKS